MSDRPTRRWGAGTSAIVRALIAAVGPASQSDLAAIAEVSQPRVSQVLAALSTMGGVTRDRDGFHPNRSALIELYVTNHRPSLAGPETYWYGLAPMRDQIAGLADEADLSSVNISVSADSAPDLIAPWRHPTLTVVYVDVGHNLELTGLVRAEGRSDATIVLRPTNDQTLLTANESFPRTVTGIPLADPTQQIWDLHHLGGEDRREAADRLRKAMLTGTLTAAR